MSTTFQHSFACAFRLILVIKTMYNALIMRHAVALSVAFLTPLAGAQTTSACDPTKQGITLCLRSCKDSH